MTPFDWGKLTAYICFTIGLALIIFAGLSLIDWVATP